MMQAGMYPSRRDVNRAAVAARLGRPVRTRAYPGGRHSGAITPDAIALCANNFSGVDVATPHAVVSLLDRRDSGLAEAIAEERCESPARLDLSPSGVPTGKGEVVGDDLVDGERRRTGGGLSGFPDSRSHRDISKLRLWAGWDRSMRE
jgi:hypothetical protein